jgi:hypothetical protein
VELKDSANLREIYQFAAFHPKARRQNRFGQVFWLTPLFRAFPPRSTGQWLVEKTTITGAYSYGDSAGLSPASLFIPPKVGTKIRCEVKTLYSKWERKVIHRMLKTSLKLFCSGMKINLKK